MLGNRGSRFDARWLVTYIFSFFINLVEKNILRVKNFSKYCENGIACLRKGKSPPFQIEMRWPGLSPSSEIHCQGLARVSLNATYNGVICRLQLTSRVLNYP